MGLSRQHFLTGQEEADAFTAKRYVPLHQSTLKKVDVISELAELAARGTLKTRAKAREVYGWSIGGLYDRIVDSRRWKVASILRVPIGLISGVWAVLEAF